MTLFEQNGSGDTPFPRKKQQKSPKPLDNLPVSGPGAKWKYSVKSRKVQAAERTISGPPRHFCLRRKLLFFWLRFRDPFGQSSYGDPCPALGPVSKGVKKHRFRVKKHCFSDFSGPTFPESADGPPIPGPLFLLFFTFGHFCQLFLKTCAPFT